MTTETTTGEAPGIEAMHARKYRIAGDQVNKATSELPDDQRSAIRWLHAHAAEHDLSLGELGKLIRYDDSTLYRVLTGKYEGSLDNVCKEINSYKSLAEQRALGRKLPFIHTAMSRRMWKVFDAALEYQRIAFIIGATQIGKTAAGIEYTVTHNHGSTVYVSVPTGGSLTNFLAVLAKALRISPQAKEKELRRRIIESFDDRMLLIVDEAHRCIRSSGNTLRPLDTIDFIRELFDEARCGVVIMATNVFGQRMNEAGTGISEILRQTKRRRLCMLQLPDSPTIEDLGAFAAAYGLPPATGQALQLQTEVIRDEALGMWLTLLRMAAKVANQRKKTMTWEHVIHAHAGLRALEGR